MIVQDTLEMLRGYERAGFSAEQAESIVRTVLATVKNATVRVTPHTTQHKQTPQRKNPNHNTSTPTFWQKCLGSHTQTTLGECDTPGFPPATPEATARATPPLPGM